MRHDFGRGVFFLAAGLIALRCRADVTGTTQPITVPATTQAVVPLPVDSPIRAWFKDLASSDAALRDQAQTELMGISPADLESLRDLIQQQPSLSAAQVAALHTIVMQVYLTGQSYEADPKGAFLGIRWSNRENPTRVGVAVEERLIGFPSYQMLRTGDLILGVLVNPVAPLDQLPNMQTHSRDTLIEAVSHAGSTDPVLFKILRQGQVFQIPVRLAARPKDVAGDDPTANNFLAARAQSAEQYWQQHFVPLFHQQMS